MAESTELAPSHGPDTAARPFRTPEASQFCDFFEALQHETGQLMPLRRALNPGKARSFLPYLFLQEVRDPDTIIMRLVGTVIVNRLGFDPTGKNMFDVMGPEEKAETWDHLRVLLDKPCGSWLIVSEPYENKSILAEVVNFPLADQHGVPRFIVGLSAEIDRQDLVLRGSSAERFGKIVGRQMIDIGAGI